MQAPPSGRQAIGLDLRYVLIFLLVTKVVSLVYISGYYKVANNFAKYIDPHFKKEKI